MIDVSSYLEQQNEYGDDSLFVWENKGIIWFCLADGAGGSGYGARASACVVETFRDLVETSGFDKPDDFESFLRKTDLELFRKNEGGETTAIIGKVEDEIIVGASVGDSEAWIYNQDYDYQLTSLQNQKPLTGSGKSIPIGFGPVDTDMHVLLGSDGLFKYTKQSEIKSLLNSGAQATEIAELAKIETGKLQDDISVILISLS